MSAKENLEEIDKELHSSEGELEEAPKMKYIIQCYDWFEGWRDLDTLYDPDEANEEYNRAKKFIDDTRLVVVLKEGNE